jgi:hypothetical protein
MQGVAFHIKESEKIWFSAKSIIFAMNSKCNVIISNSTSTL